MSTGKQSEWANGMLFIRIFAPPTEVFASIRRECSVPASASFSIALWLYAGFGRYEKRSILDQIQQKIEVPLSCPANHYFPETASKSTLR